MLKIFSAPANVQGGIRVKQATADMFGGGSGLIEAGKAITEFGDELKARADRSDAVEIETALIKAETDFTARQLELSQQAKPGAHGFIGAVSDEVNNFGREFQKNFSQVSPENKQRLELGLARLRAGSVRKAMVFEAGSRAKKIAGDVKTGLGDLQNGVRLNPAALQENMERAERLIDASGMAADVAANLKKTTESDFIAASFVSRIGAARTPEELETATGDLEKFQDRMDAADFARVHNSALQGQKLLADKVESEFITDVRTDLKEAVFGIPVSTTEADIRANVADVREQERLIEDLNIAKAAGDTYRSVRHMSTAQIEAAEVELRRNLTDRPGNVEQDEATLRAFGVAKSAHLDRLKSDPVTYIGEIHPSVARAQSQYHTEAAAALQNPQDAAAQIAAVTARDEYVAMLSAAQARAGITTPQLLTRNELAQFKTSLESVEQTPEGAENLRDLMAAQVSKWGNHWPTVARQLETKEVITGAHRALARIAGDLENNTVSIDLARALSIPAKEMKSLIPSSQDTGFNKTMQGLVAGEMLAFNGTLAAQGAISTAADYKSGVEHLAMYYMTKGMTPNAAVTKAFDGLIGKDYTFVNKYRVPVEHDADEVALGAATVKRSLDVFNISPVLGLNGGAMPSDQVASSLAANGGWVTSADESGLVLVDEFGHAVQTTDDEGGAHPLSFTWTALKQMALQPGPGGRELRNMAPELPPSPPVTPRRVGTRKIPK